MLRLLNIELHKLRYTKSAKIITILYFILITLIAFLASREYTFFGSSFRFADQGVFNFPYIWHFNTYMATWAKFFLVLVIVSMISSEYSHRTLKQNLIDGLSKKEFIATKFLTLTFFALLSTLYIALLSLILGFSFTEHIELSNVFGDTIYLAAYFLKLLGFFSICMCACIWVKNSAFSLGVVFIWWVIENITYWILSYIFPEDSTLPQSIRQFFPLEAMETLISEPISRMEVVQSAANQFAGGINIDYAVHWYELAIVTVWIAIFVGLSYLILQRRDL